MYLEPSELRDAYNDSEKAALEFHSRYNEFDRLAKNKLNPKMDKTFPKVNDGSLSALLKEVPRRVLAQMSTGRVTTEDNDEEWLKELINIIWEQRIIKGANSQMPFFEKYRLWLYRSVVYGGAPAYSFFNSSGKKPTSDFILPDPRRVYLEDGKVSDLDSDYIFMDVWYKKRQLKGFIKAAEDEIEKAAAEQRKPNLSWDPEVLKELVNTNEEQIETDRQNGTEKDSNEKLSGLKMSACLQRGHEAPFYLFAPTIGNKVARTWANDDVTGNLPITYMYADQDLENPYGVSQLTYSGPIQNVLDYLTQAFLLATQIGLQPPIKIGGDVSALQSKSLIYAPRQKWFIGNANVDQADTNNQTYALYPQNYGLFKTQLMNQQGTTDASVSGESGNPQYSKTPAGINLQQERTNANDNTLRQNASTAFERLAQSLINKQVANSEGSELLRLHGRDLDRMVKTGLIDEDPTTQQPSTNEIEVIWDNLRGEYSFEVDSNSSIKKEDDEKTNSLLETLNLVTSNPVILQSLQMEGYTFNIGEAVKQIIIKKGVDDWEKILQQTGKGGPATASGADPQLQEVMQQYGVAENEAMAILDARSQGIPEDEIVRFLSERQVAA